MTVPPLSPLCVFTIKNLDELASIHQSGGTGGITENKPWTTAKRLVDDAKRDGESVAVFFSDAAHVGKLHYWAILTSITVNDGTTNYRFKNLCRFERKPRQDTLLVTSTGQSLSMVHIRPYVLCSSPSPKSALHVQMGKAKEVPSHSAAAPSASADIIAEAKPFINRQAVPATVKEKQKRTSQEKSVRQESKPRSAAVRPGSVTSGRTSTISEKDRLTIFSFGYYGWGTHTAELIEAVDAVEKSRGFEPPFFVDIRISQAVRAKGFNGKTFEKRVGPERHLWMKSLGNTNALSAKRGIQIAEPETVTDLLHLARLNGKEKRRVIYFCHCQFARCDGEDNCHRATVSQLLLNAAKKERCSIQVVEWPGGNPTHIHLNVSNEVFRAVRNGRMTIPLEDGVADTEMLGLPSGSVATLHSDGESFHRIVGPAMRSKMKWCLPVLWRFFDQGAGLAEYKEHADSLRQDWGMEPVTA